MSDEIQDGEFVSFLDMARRFKSQWDEAIQTGNYRGLRLVFPDTFPLNVTLGQRIALEIGGPYMMLCTVIKQACKQVGLPDGELGYAHAGTIRNPLRSALTYTPNCTRIPRPRLAEE